MALRLQERTSTPAALTVGLPVLAVVVTLVVTSVAILLADADPFLVYRQLLLSPLSSRFTLLEVLVVATPLLFTGLAVAVAFRAGYYNIGAEGQLLAGAIAAAGLGMVTDGWSPWAAVPAMIVGGAVAGMAWAAVPALLRVRFGIDEVVTTLLLNPVALLVVSGLLNGPWRDPETGFPESPRIAVAAEFPQVVARSRLHLGFVLVTVLLAVAWFVLSRTPTGLRLRATGLSPRGAAFVGIRVPRVLLVAALVSGAIAGLAGVSEVAGLQYRLTEGISPGYGYTGIVVATLGGLTVGGVGLAALLLGLIGVGTTSTGRALGIPSQLGQVIIGALLLVTVGTLLLRRFRILRVRRGAAR
jgi:ABC-type uncharacterized transport system permease subunit